MCGITGIYHLDSAVDSETIRLVSAMTGSFAHRGPDAEGIYHNGKVCLGHRRLAIIDLDARSNQPFTDATGRYTIVFNGQIYNFREIRSEIPEYPFHTESDTEVIVAAYAKWGGRCPEKMNGMFALAIYDAVEQSIFLARDRFGIKPLYYYLDAQCLMFASEIRTLLQTGRIPHKLSHEGLREYFMYQSTACPNSIVDGIKQVYPAHYARIHNGKLEQTRYWAFGTTSNGVAKSYKEALGDVRRLLSTSVERRMISDVPLGAFLSGGIDSSAIVALMSEIATQVDTFSIVFDEPVFDESPFSDLIAKKYNTRHHKLLLRPSAFLSELPHALEAMDSPSADGMNTYVVAKLTKNAGITVAMSGLGADELFAGYHNYRIWSKLNKSGYFLLPAPLRNLLSSAMRRRMKHISGDRIKTISKSRGDISKAYPAFREVMSSREADVLLQGVASEENHEIVSLEQIMIRQFKTISQYSLEEMTNYMRNVLLKDTDQFSMASALEVRVPFLDHELVDYVLKLPDAWKLGAMPKKLLTESMGSLLPEAIVHRPKRGFTFPWQSWLRNELRETVTENVLFLQDVPEFNSDEVLKIHADFMQDKRPVAWKYVWQLAVLGHWIQKHLH